VTVGLVSGEERAALIDCGSTPAQGMALLEQARDLAGTPVTHVVVTHPHHDHWFGLAGMTGVTSIAHENLTRDPEPEVLEAAAAIGLKRLPGAAETFSLAKSLDLGGVRLELLHLGSAHTRADVVVVIPEEEIIFMGDLVESAGDPQFGPASDVRTWPRVLDDVLGASTESTRFVPGHALETAEPPELTVNRKFCFRQRAEIAMVQGTVENLVDRGVALENAFDAAEWPFGRDTMRVVLPLIYQRLADRGVTPKRHLPLA
jgi:beta-lactamase domain protein